MYIYDKRSTAATASKFKGGGRKTLPGAMFSKSTTLYCKMAFFLVMLSLLFFKEGMGKLKEGMGKLGLRKFPLSPSDLATAKYL